MGIRKDGDEEGMGMRRKGWRKGRDEVRGRDGGRSEKEKWNGMWKWRREEVKLEANKHNNASLQYNEVMFQHLWYWHGHIKQHPLSAVLCNHAKLVDQHQSIRELLLKVITNKMVGQPSHDLQDRGKVLQYCVKLLTVCTLRDSQTAGWGRDHLNMRTGLHTERRGVYTQRGEGSTHRGKRGLHTEGRGVYTQRGEGSTHRGERGLHTEGRGVYTQRGEGSTHRRERGLHTEGRGVYTQRGEGSTHRGRGVYTQKGEGSTHRGERGLHTEGRGVYTQRGEGSTHRGERGLHTEGRGVYTQRGEGSTHRGERGLHTEGSKQSPVPQGTQTHSSILIETLATTDTEAEFKCSDVQQHSQHPSVVMS